MLISSLFSLQQTIQKCKENFTLHHMGKFLLLLLNQEDYIIRQSQAKELEIWPNWKTAHVRLKDQLYQGPLSRATAQLWFERHHDKTYKMTCTPSKATQTL